MKKLFTLFAALLLAATVWAQSSSPKMSYQAVVRNAANELVVNRTDLTVVISVKQADTVAYKETHTNVKTNQNGLLSLLIGEGNVNKGSLNDVDWTKAEISTSINLGGETVSATAPVTAVPYALYAETVNPNSAFVTEIQGDITEITDNYLTKAGLCDSIKNCDKIKQMDNAITGNANAISAIDGRIKTDSLEIVELYTTTMETVLGKIKSDSTALAGQISTNASSISTNASDITDIKENYLTKAGLCDSIKNCDAIKDLTDTLDFYYTKEEINDTLNAYYDTTKINDTLKSYLTITGLCDSIKSCDIIQDLTDTLDFYYTKEEINDTLNAYYDTTKINDTLKSYLTITGLCDSIKSCETITNLYDTLEYYYTKTKVNDTLGNYYTKEEINTAVDTLLSTSALDSLITTTDLKDSLSHYEIKNCTDVAICVNSKLSNDNTVMNHIIDTIVDNHINGAMDSLLKKNALDTLLTISALDSLVTDNELTTALSEYKIKNCNDVKNCVEDTLGNYYTKEEINTAVDTLLSTSALDSLITTTDLKDTLKSYLTIDGLCDSIKSCDAIKDLTDTLKYYYTKEEIKDTLNAYYDTTKINDTLKSYLTIDGLCDSIKNKCTDIATITTVQTAIHDSLKNINIPDVSDMLTCENIASCDKIALVGSANTFTGKNTFNDTIDAKDGAVLVTSVVTNDGTIGANDSLRAVNAKDLASYVDNAVAAKQVTLTILSITVEDSTKLMNDTTLTIPAGFDTLDLSHLVQFYINGVYVGDTDDQVLTVNATTKKVHYDPTKNGGYALKAGDRIKIIYWVKKN